MITAALFPTLELVGKVWGVAEGWSFAQVSELKDAV